jgi:hypothetical protein
MLFCYNKSLGILVLCLAHLATLCQPTGMKIRWLTVQKSVIKYPSVVLLTNICNVKQTPTRDDKKSAAVFQIEPTARKYKKCRYIVSAEMTDMRCSVLWVTACLGNLRWMDGNR